MKTKLRFIPTITSLSLLLFSAAGVQADTIILKNGTRYQGRILKDEGDSYLCEIQVTRSIRDERRFPKADIEKIEKENTTAAEYLEIAKLNKTPDLLEPGDYDRYIRQVRAFIDKHSTAKETIDARKLITALETERDAIAAGAIKLNGRLISSSERAADMVAIDSAILGKKFEKAAMEGRVIEALRTFAILDEQFQGCQAHSQALPLVNKVLASYQAQIIRSLASLDKTLKDREIGLERMPAVDRERAKRIFAEQEANIIAHVAIEKEQKIKWITVNPYDESSLRGAQRRINSEIKRLERPPSSSSTTTQAPDAGYREAWTELEGADQEQVSTILSNVAKLRLPEKYTRALEDRAAAVAAPEEEEKKPE